MEITPPALTDALTGYLELIPTATRGGFAFRFGGYARDASRLSERAAPTAVVVSMERARWLARQAGCPVPTEAELRAAAAANERVAEVA